MSHSCFDIGKSSLTVVSGVSDLGQYLPKKLLMRVGLGDNPGCCVSEAVQIAF